MTAHTSASLGWVAGTNIASQLRNFCDNIAAAGDTLTITGMFNVTGRSYQFPSNFTMTGTGANSGFNITDSATGSWVFIAGSNNVFEHLNFLNPNAPETGYAGNNPVSGVDHDLSTTLHVAAGATCRWCKFSGHIGAHIRVYGRLTLENCLLEKGKYIIYGVSNTKLLFKDTFFRLALIDGTKIIEGGRHADWLIENCIYEEGRDGIDLTGGLHDATINDCIFRRNSVTAFDAKISHNNAGSYTTGSSNKFRNIRLNRCQFIDNLDQIVFTWNPNYQQDNGVPITLAMQTEFSPQDILMTDCVYEKSLSWTGSVSSSHMIKHGFNLHSLRPTYRGSTGQDWRLHPLNLYDGFTIHDYGNQGTVTRTTARATNSDVHFAFGPGGAAPEEPGIPPAPVSAGPAIKVNATTGLLSIDPSRLPVLTAKPFTARVTTGYGSDTDVFTVTNTLS